MSHATNVKVPVWFWIVAAIAVLWNLAGVGAYLSDVYLSEQAFAELPEAQRDLREATPAFVTGAYAIAVFGGLIASIALLLRRRWAVPLFVVSLLAVVVQFGYLFIVMDAADALGEGSTIFPAVIVVAGIALLWFSVHAKGRGWLS